MIALRPDMVPGHHLLAVAEEVSPEEIEALACSRWPNARWSTGEELTITRHTRLVGPLTIAADVAAELGLPAELPTGYLVHGLVERGEPAFIPDLDPTGLARAFPDGLPTREEGRVADWLIAAARRLAGAVRFDPSGLVLMPRQDAAIDLAVHSDVWLDPDAALLVIRSVLPNARAAIELTPWKGPATGPDQQPAPPGVELDPAHLRYLHAEARAFDEAALATGGTLDAYEVVSDLGQGNGLVTVEIDAKGEPPLVLQGLPWAADGVITYRIRWIPADSNDLLREFPPQAHQELAAQVMVLLGQVAAAIYRATGVEITDADGFLLSPSDL